MVSKVRKYEYLTLRVLHCHMGVSTFLSDWRILCGNLIVLIMWNRCLILVDGTLSHVYPIVLLNLSILTDQINFFIFIFIFYFFAICLLMLAYAGFKEKHWTSSVW